MNITGLYTKLYGLICGHHPKQNILHDEWLCLKDTHTNLKEVSPLIGGKTLDVGCGSKPYKDWFSNVTEYIGGDIGDNIFADVAFEEDQAWQFQDREFDTILSFQVFEHVKNLGLAQDEIDRVLKPNGTVVLSIPFCAYEHGAPNDYRRFTREGVKQLFPEYEVVNVKTEGGVGSNVGTLILRWVRISMTRTKALRIAFAILMPFWILFTLVTNVLGFFLDKIDVTQSLYHNVMIILKKPER